MKTKQLKLLFWTLCVGGLISHTEVQSQQISVAKFYHNATDLTANTHGTELKDINGEKCALLKIETTQTGFIFECGSIAPTEVQYKEGEIWVYVSRGVKRITVKHPHLGVLRDYEFPVPIESARTYIMQLSLGEVTTLVKERLTKGYLIFKVNPPDATLYVNEEVVLLEKGQAALFKDFGTYEYRVEHPSSLYHAQAGKVSLTKEEAKVSVEMKPNFGYLNISAASPDMQGASVFVNGRLAGKIPYKSDKMKSGSCNIIVKKELYEQYSSMVTIPSNGTDVIISPSLTPRFAAVKLEFDNVNRAEIWIDGKKQGDGSWQGNLEYGDHLVECKAANHRSTSKKISIAAPQSKTFKLEPPIPITGNLRVSAKPFGTKIFLDGKDVGETPKLLSEVLVGKHEVRLENEGYAKKSVSVEIKEGELTTVDEVLEEAAKTGSLYIVSKPSLAKIVLDGRYEGVTPKRLDSIAIGEHEVQLEAEGYEKKVVSVTTMSGEETMINEVLEKLKMGSLYVNAQPAWSSNIFLDGKSMGKVPLRMGNIAPGKHEVRLEAVGYKTKTMKVKITGGESTSVNEVLKKKYTHTPPASDGPINVLISLAVPGLGLCRVTGSAIGLVTMLPTYALMGAGIGFKVSSNKEYAKYHAATTQAEMDEHFAKAHKANRNFYGCMIAGGVIWLTDIIATAARGAKNVKGYNHLGYYYNPELDAMGLSYTIKF